MDTIKEADEVLSTGGMCSFVKKSGPKPSLSLPKWVIIHRLKKENPNADYIPSREDGVFRI
jgi:quinolinate synthase